jgi:restriction system protein
MAQISKERIGEYLQAGLRAIDLAGGSLPVKQVFLAIEQALVFSEYEAGILEKSGNTRWRSIVYFYSIDCIKAGWMRKNAGVWYLTEEGRQALSLSPKEFMEEAGRRYKEWKKMQGPESLPTEERADESILSRASVFEQAQLSARTQIEQYIDSLGPYEFQDLCAALLRGMGFYTPFVAPRGKDGGVDIVAYRDPIGLTTPRLKVQVKHRDQKVERKEVSELHGVLHEQDAGLMISSGGFTADAEMEIRRSRQHIEKMDLSDFIGSWERYYDSLQEKDKTLLPLRRISFLAPEE